MGRIVCRFFAFSDFSGFRLLCGLINAGIVLDTSAVFLNARVIVRDFNYGPIMAIVC